MSPKKLIIIGVLLAALFYGIVVFISIKACHEIQEVGLKNIVHDIWNGEQK